MALSYVPLYKKSTNNGGLKFEKEDFEDRIKSQQELHMKLDPIFDSKETMNLEEFTSVSKNKNSDYLFIYFSIFI